MSKKVQPKVPEKKAWRAEDYASLTVPIEEVRDIKTAFDIFDGDLSGIVDPQELKHAFEQLGFAGSNKFVYQILAELDDDQSGGIDFAEFLRLATAKMSDKDSRAEIEKVWGSFDVNRSVTIILFRAKSPPLNSRRSPKNWEKTWLKTRSTTCSSRLILMMMDLSPLTISTTLWPIRFIGSNEHDLWSIIIPHNFIYLYRLFNKLLTSLREFLIKREKRSIISRRYFGRYFWMWIYLFEFNNSPLSNMSYKNNSGWLCCLNFYDEGEKVQEESTHRYERYTTRASLSSPLHQDTNVRPITFRPVYSFKDGQVRIRSDEKIIPT